MTGVALDELPESTRMSNTNELRPARAGTHLLSELAENVLRVKLDERLTKDDAHLVD